MDALVKFFRKAWAIRQGTESPVETLTPFVVRILSYLGIWAEAGRMAVSTTAYKLLMLFHHCVFGILAITMVLNLFEPTTDLFTFADHFGHAIAVFGAFLKAEILQWHRKTLTEIFAKVAQNDEKLKLECAKNPKIDRLRREFFWTELSLVVPFLLSDIAAVSFKLTQIPEERSLPFAATFPFDTGASTIGHLVAYFIQCWGTVFLSFNYILMDAGIGSCYNQIALQFQVVGIKVEAIGEIEKISERRGRLINIIREHDELFRLLRDFNSALDKFFMVILSLSLLTITFNTFTMASVGKAELFLIVQLMTFWLVMTTNFLFWCYLGQKIEDMVQTYVYNCDWPGEDKGTKMCILLLLMRSQKPARLRIDPFFQFNYESFAKVIKMSMSYFMVLKDVSK